MSQPLSAERLRRRWGWWFAGGLGVLMLIVALRLAYPTVRQQQLITQLSGRGFRFNRLTFDNFRSASWTAQAWIPARWRNVVGQEIEVFYPRGNCLPEDFEALSELVSLDQEGIQSPPRCWLSLNLANAIDDELTTGSWQQRLRTLTCTSPKVTDAGLAFARQAIHLTALRIDSTQIGDPGLAHLARSRRLVDLQLNGQHITDAGLVHLKRLARLRSLRLSGSRITDAGLMHLAGLTSLRHLDLSGSQISGPGLIHLAKLRHLSGLYLNGTPFKNNSFADGQNVPAFIQRFRLQGKPATPSRVLNLKQ